MLFTLCLFNEMFYVSLYIYSISNPEGAFMRFLVRHANALVALSAPLWLLKQYINVVQMLVSIKSLVALDQKKGK